MFSLLIDHIYSSHCFSVVLNELLHRNGLPHSSLSLRPIPPYASRASRRSKGLFMSDAGYASVGGELDH